MPTDGDRQRDDRDRSAGDIERLRALLVGREQERLDRLERQRVDPADLGDALPAAIQSREQPDRDLGAALSPTIEEGIRESVRKDPQTIADSIFPVLGPAIRNYITDALNRFVQSTNTIIEHSLSPRSLAWRMEALWTRKPFAEVVLMHSLFYKVEQAFLIFRESGMLLHQVRADDVDAWDGDLLSGMLTALGDFAHDSFKMDDEDALESFKVGGLKVRVVRSRLVLLAVAVRGTPPADLDPRLEDAVHQIQADYHDQLADYAGDPAAFDDVDEAMRVLLLEKRRHKEKKRGIPWLGITAVLAIVAAVGYFVLTAAIARSRRNAYVKRLRDEAGIVVTDARMQDGKFVVRGMRDEDAVEPASLLPTFDLDASDVVGKWQPFVSLDPAFVARRVNARFDPPQGATLRVENRVLVAAGEAPLAWVDRVRAEGTALPGVEAVDLAGCRVVDADERMTVRTRAVLSPPKGVEMHVVGRVLRIIGTAPHAWARDVASRLSAAGIDVSVDRAALVVTDAPESLAARVARILAAPRDVTVSVGDDGLVTLEGRARGDWADRALARLDALPGVTGVRSELTIVDRVARVLRRARLALRPPPGVELAFEGETLAARGRASHRWIDDARRFAPLVAGVARFDGSALVDVDREQLRDAAVRLADRVLRFDTNRRTPAAGQDDVLAAIARDIADIQGAARALGEPRIIVVSGLTLKQNGSVIRSLARERADATIDSLVRREGLSRRLFRAQVGEQSGSEAIGQKAVRFSVDSSPR